MKQIIIGLLLVLVVGCSPDNSDVIQPATQGSQIYQVGQQVYALHCASCHGANGEGQFPDNPLEPDSTGRYGAPPHNPNGHTWHHDDDLLIRYLHEGGLGDPALFYPMPAFQTVLTDGEIIAVIAYIKSFWTPEQVVRQRDVTRAIRAQNSN